MYKGLNNGRSITPQMMEKRGSWSIVNPHFWPIKCSNLLLTEPSPEQDPKKNEECLAAMIDNSIVKTYKKGTELLNGSPESNVLYYLTSGTVQLSMISMKNIDEDGIIVLSYLTKGNFFGEMGLCVEGGNAGLFADATSDITVAKISYDRFRALCVDHPNLKTLILNQITSSLVSTRQRLIDTVIMQMVDKTKQVLRELESHERTMMCRDRYVINLNRKELATIVGCSREMVYRSLVNLEKAGMVELHGSHHKVTVFRDRLNADGCY